MGNLVNLYVGTSGKNPGPATYGVVLINPETGHSKEISGGFSHTVQNRVAIMAIIRGLEALKKHCRVKVFCPAEWVVVQINNGTLDRHAEKNWRKSDGSLIDKHELWQRLYDLMNNHDVQVIWCSRKSVSSNLEESTIRELERAARLAHTAWKETELPPDEGYQK